MKFDIDSYDYDLFIFIITYLRKHGYYEALRLLARCTDVTVESTEEHYSIDEEYDAEAWGPSDRVEKHLLITCPPDVFHAFQGIDKVGRQQLNEAFHWAGREWYFAGNIKDEETGLPILPGTLCLRTDWRALLADILQSADGQSVNQGVDVPTSVVWNDLRLGSPPESSIADALDHAGVLFFTNSPVRLGAKGQRKKLYPDFVVCHNGKWGIIEVDGAAYHKPENKAQEDTRNEVFYGHGISVIRHYQARDCTRDPHGIVKRFLEQLEKFG